jgi:hypothetical protein
MVAGLDHIATLYTATAQVVFGYIAPQRFELFAQPYFFDALRGPCTEYMLEIVTAGADITGLLKV